MNSVQGRRRPYWERPSVAPSITLFDSSLSLKLGDKLCKQSAGPSEIKSLIIIIPDTTINIPQYSKDDF